MSSSRLNIVKRLLFSMKRTDTEQLVSNAAGIKRQTTRITSKTHKLAEDDDFWLDIKPAYYFEGGFRKVRPYYFEYRSFAKARWIGRTLLDVFTSEFRDRPTIYYTEAVKNNLVCVNGNPVGLDYLIKDRDLISHRIHRHEPPVLDTPIQIIYHSKDLMVVNKPASVPVHPSGRYRFNTLVEILKQDHHHLVGNGSLSLINRLDRPTSGLVLIGLTKERAESLHQAMESRLLSKEYICQVKGVFPQTTDEWITCDRPLLVIEHKLGLVVVDEMKGKPSQTLFKRHSTDGTTSIVLAKPLTGRTHQIRVHLQYLGYPIVNDSLYNRPDVWKDYKGGVVDPKILASARSDLLKEEETKEIDKAEEAKEISKTDKPGEQPIQTEDASPSPQNESHASLNVICPECFYPPVDPQVSSLQLNLHAFRYSSAEWSFSADFPPWAN